MKRMVLSSGKDEEERYALPGKFSLSLSFSASQWLRFLINQEDVRILV